MARLPLALQCACATPQNISRYWGTSRTVFPPFPQHGPITKATGCTTILQNLLLTDIHRQATCTAEVARRFDMSGVFGDKGYITREVHPLLEATKPRHRVTSRAQRLKLSWHRKAPSPGGSQKAGLSQCASLFVVAISVGLRAVAPAGASGAFVLTASQPRRAGAAGSWRLPSSAPPAAAAAAVAVAASGKSFFFTHSSWSPSTLCLDQCSAAAPAATAAMRMSTPASQFGKSGEMPQDDGGYWSDTSQLATQAELVELSNFHLDACGTAESSILSGDPDIDDVNEGGHHATVTPGVRGKKEPHHKLSGTWLPGGLPRSVHIVWKRMLTKQDWLHLHASSSLVRDTLSYIAILPVCKTIEHLFFWRCLHMQIRFSSR